MNIGYKNKKEEKQILDILLDLGYLFHGEEKYTTSEEIIKEWNQSYSAVSIDYSKRRPRSIQLTHENHYQWSENYGEIMSRLTNFKLEKKDIIRISQVGDYDATVTKDAVDINGRILTHDTVKEIYKIFDMITESDEKTLHITVDGRDELSALLGMITAMGWCDTTVDDMVEYYLPYKSIMLRADLTIGGNYVFYKDYDNMEHIFSKDLSEIYNSLINMKKSVLKLPDIGEYDVMLRKDHVRVGCQRITKEKVKEIVDAIDAFND